MSSLKVTMWKEDSACWREVDRDTLRDFLKRHQSLDFGEVSLPVYESNMRAVRSNNGVVNSIYFYKDKQVRITTNMGPDGSYTPQTSVKLEARD
jgi:hypothetical protein